MDYQKIDKKAIKAWILARSIFLIIFAGIYGFLSYKLGLDFVDKFAYGPLVFYSFTILIFSVFIIFTFVFPFIEYREWSYKILSDRIELKNGIFIKKRIIIPITRVQYLDINQGPIYRFFALSSLRLNTAGSMHTIPALTEEESEEISLRLKEVIEMSDNLE